MLISSRRFLQPNIFYTKLFFKDFCLGKYNSFRYFCFRWIEGICLEISILVNIKNFRFFSEKFMFMRNYIKKN